MANAPAPINVSVAPGAGITADLDIFLDSADPFVLGTPFLDWTQHPALGAVPARASVPHHRLVAHFLLRHERGVSAADLAAFDNHTPLTSNFVAAAWSRWLTNIVASGFLTSGVFDRARDARAALMALALQSPLVILASDFGPFESFDIPGVAGVAAIPPVAAVPGRRARGGQPAVRAVRAQPGVPGVPAVPATPGPPALAFLSVTNLTTFYSIGSSAPLLAFCRLAGILGGCHTRAARLSVVSAAHSSGLLLRSYVAKHMGLPDGVALNPATDALLGLNVPTASTSAFDALSEALAASRPIGLESQHEMRDGFILLYGSEQEREAVYVRRLRFIETR